MIIPAPASRELGSRIARILHARIVEVESKSFPDGDSYVRFTEGVTDQELAIIQSTYPPQDTHLMQLFLVADTAAKLGAKKLVAVVPYLAYARQDKAFRPNEAVSIKTILKLMTCCKFSDIITVNVHEPSALLDSGIRVVNLSAVRALMNYMKNLDLQNPVIFAPDKKAVKLALEANEIVHGSSGWFSKVRDRITGEISLKLESETEIKNRDVIMIDDIVSSGQTIATAAKVLKARGAKRVFATCIHAILNDSAYEKIIENGADEVIATDTIPTKFSRVSVAETIAEHLKNL